MAGEGSLIYRQRMEEQYKAVSKVWEIVSLLYMMGMLIAPSTLIYNLTRALMLLTVLLVGFFSNIKQVGKAQLLWSACVVLYFFLHTLSGTPVNTASAWHRLGVLAMNYLILNIFILQTQTEEGYDIFIKNLTIAVMALNFIIVINQGSELASRRFGNLAVHYPFGRVVYNSNGAGLVNALCLLLQLYRFDRDKEKKRFAVIAINFLVIVLSGSRKSLLCIVGFIFIYMFFHEKQHRLRNVIIAMILAVIMIILVLNVPVMYSLLGARLENYVMSVFAQEELTESSAIVRGKMIDTGLYWLSQRPFSGYGLDNYQYLQGSYGTYSHNNYVELAISGGWQVIPLYYWFYLYVLIKLITSKEDLKLQATGLAVMMLLPILEYGWVTYLDSKLIFYITVGYAPIARSESKRRMLQSHFSTDEGGTEYVGSKSAH